MKKVLMILAASMLSAGMPVMAAEHAHKSGDENCIRECQMLVKNCGQEVDSIENRISRLSAEIRKGASVYSAEELQMLQRKLQESQDLLGSLSFGG